MKRKIGLCIALLVTVTDVMATDWTSIIKDNKHEVLVDIDSYNVANNLPYLVAKTIYQSPQHFALPDTKKQYSISVAKFQFNCAEPLYRIRTIQLMNHKNKLLDTVKINSGFQKLDINTDEYAIGQLTCQVHQMVGGASL